MTVLDDVIARVVRTAEPDRIVLFGSAARGDFRTGSDLDLLVIKSGVVHRRHLAQAIYKALAGIGASVDVVVVTPEDIAAYKDGVATVIGPALREGREIYAA